MIPELGKRCTCHSANNPDGGTPAVICRPPGSTRDHSIDACIYPTLAHLWSKGIETRNSCCGHNLQAPSVLLDPDAPRPDHYVILAMIAEVDPRMWSVVYVPNRQAETDLRAQLAEARTTIETLRAHIRVLEGE
jgi:hypothetical protein